MFQRRTRNARAGAGLSRAVADPDEASPAPFFGVEPGRVTTLLGAWSNGDAAAHETLVGLLYPRLRRLARRARRGEAAGHTLATTALVHEAYLRLMGADIVWADARHFLSVAARAMRRVLVDHARARNRNKRRGGAAVLALDGVDERVASPQRPVEFLHLDEAIERLLALDERKGIAIELLYFGGLSYAEIAQVLEMSSATVHRELRAARAWLHKELSDGCARP